MNVGLIARADDRGLGILTWEFHRHVHPARTLVVREPGAEGQGFVAHLDRYPDATVVTYDGTLPELVVREWLTGLDVLYSAETFYDERVLDWARVAGVATVLHVMPEFYRGTQPTAVWAPTPWRVEHLPADARLVPVPVADDRFPFRSPERDGQLRVLHTAGHRAAADRNGTTQLLQALRRTHQPMAVTLLTQDRTMGHVRGNRNLTVTTETHGRADYWDLYASADVLVLPRRYGGLSLPVQEAMASGLAVVMPDCEPNSWWPTLRVRAKRADHIDTPGGRVPLYSASPLDLAALLDQLAVPMGALHAAQAASVEWARQHAWGALLSLYEAELAEAANRCQAEK